MNRSLLILGIGCLLAPWMATEVAAEATVSDVEACVSRNLPDQSGVLEFTLSVQDREGGVRESAAQLLWRRPAGDLARVVLRISEPEETRGTSVLVIERDDADPELFIYLPAISKVKKLRKGRLQGSLLGTDFSYEDFERVQGFARKAKVSLLGSSHVGDRDVWMLEAKPDLEEESGYKSIITHVDQEYCLPLRMEFYDQKNRLRKVLTSDPKMIRREGDHFVPQKLVMRDLRDRTKTQVTVRTVTIDPGLGPNEFTEHALMVQPR